MSPTVRPVARHDVAADLCLQLDGSTAPQRIDIYLGARIIDDHTYCANDIIIMGFITGKSATRMLSFTADELGDSYQNTLFTYATTCYQAELEPGLLRSGLFVAIVDLIAADTCFVRLMVFPASASRNTYRQSEILSISCRSRQILTHVADSGSVYLAGARPDGGPVENFIRMKRSLRQWKSQLGGLVDRWAQQKAELKIMFGNHNVHSFGRVVRVSGTTIVDPSWSNNASSISKSLMCNDLLIFIELTGRYISAIQKKLSGSYVRQDGCVVDASDITPDVYTNIDWVQNSLLMVTECLNLQWKVFESVIIFSDWCLRLLCYVRCWQPQAIDITMRFFQEPRPYQACHN